jgi:hypothetical protein
MARGVGGEMVKAPSPSTLFSPEEIQNTSTLNISFPGEECLEAALLFHHFTSAGTDAA